MVFERKIDKAFRFSMAGLPFYVIDSTAATSSCYCFGMLLEETAKGNRNKGCQHDKENNKAPRHHTQATEAGRGGKKNTMKREAKHGCKR